MNDMLKYDTPAKNWFCGLPIGNGRLAAMVQSGDEGDLLTLNNEWLWRGRYREKPLEDVSDRLDEVRSLLLNKHYPEASKLANDLFGGNGGISGIPQRVDAYQVAADLRLTPHRSFCTRSLDITRGVASVCREGGLKGEFFASCIGSGIYARYSSDEVFDLDAELTRVDDPNVDRFIIAQNRLSLFCGFKDGISFEVSAELITDGKKEYSNGVCRIRSATYVECRCDVTTDVRPQAKAEFLPWCEEFASHCDRFSSAMNAFRLELDTAEDSPLSTDERVRAVKAGNTDVGLNLLYFNFGRYLFLSSTIIGELPANLQGKWNDMISPPWESDYHFDINLEMNYWGAETLGMPRSVEPLVDYLLSFIPSARIAAKKLYGCRGICLPLQTDAWGISTPEAYGWAVWIGAAPWMAQHLWRHYTYSGDVGFLRDKAYLFFKEVAEFYEDYLVDIDGRLEILPSQSPENRFIGCGNMPVAICISAAMDVQLAYDALTYAADAANILGIDRERAEKWLEMRSKLPPFGIGSDGRLLEWREEFDEDEPGHRHLSHLYGLYPGELFTPEKNSAQYHAAIRSLRYRLAQGGGHTGWSRAWVAALMARIGDAEGFEEHYTALAVDFATDSLLDIHPYGDGNFVFQIDGNFGGMAAVSEALVSKADGVFRLLHTLPKSWLKGGRMSGMRLEGGHTLAFEWKDGRVCRGELRLGYSGAAGLSFNGKVHLFEGKEGEVLPFEG